ncbi:MAG TPA: RtcB family protein [Caulifigura sp.]|nr:RtcB family protein [Caulifigura sp.]
MKTSPASLFVRSIDALKADVARVVDRVRLVEDVQHVAVMPDAHLARDVCVGMVVATKELIYPAAVGSDIGCGMAAVVIESDADLLEHADSAGLLLASLYRGVPSNKHLVRRELPPPLRVHSLSDRRLDRLAERDGGVQLGTLGRGNHFLEFQADDAARLWMMVHSGSRAMGQAITNHHLERSAGRSSGLPFLDAGTDAGQAYLTDVAWAREFAASNRLAMLRAVESILNVKFTVSVDWSSLIHSDHDHVRRERHFGEELWVHRKGAQSARVGEAGIVPGSMATSTFHVTGRGLPESLASCSHGAGRRLSREAARRQIGLRQLERELGTVWCNRRRLPQLRDESPSAYQEIEKVVQAQRDLLRIVRRLKPLLSYKGM